MVDVPVNCSGALTGGTSWMLGESRLGLIATAGFRSKWRTRDNLEQTPGSADLSVIDKDYRRVSSESRAVTNALVGLGYEFGDDNKLRWTNLYIHDTLKRTSLAEGRQNNQRFGAEYLEQTTGWYERQLLSTQLTGEMKLDPVTIGARASYSKSKRDAPFELGLGYLRSNQDASPDGSSFVNRLDNGQTGYATATFSDLDEDLRSAGVDLTAPILSNLTMTVGYDFTNTARDSTRREFQIVAPSDFPSGVGIFRPDYLLGSDVIDYHGRPDRDNRDRSCVRSAPAHERGLYAVANAIDGFAGAQRGCPLRARGAGRPPSPGIQWADQLRRLDQSG
jgi:hypothetical protein